MMADDVATETIWSNSGMVYLSSTGLWFPAVSSRSARSCLLLQRTRKSARKNMQARNHDVTIGLSWFCGVTAAVMPATARSTNPAATHMTSTMT